MGPAKDKHQAPTFRLKPYVRAVIEYWVCPPGRCRCNKRGNLKTFFKITAVDERIVNTAVNIFCLRCTSRMLYQVTKGSWGHTTVFVNTDISIYTDAFVIIDLRNTKQRVCSVKHCSSPIVQNVKYASSDMCFGSIKSDALQFKKKQ